MGDILLKLCDGPSLLKKYKPSFLAGKNEPAHFDSKTKPLFSFYAPC